jgi:hypothetical protein
MVIKKLAINNPKTNVRINGMALLITSNINTP